ncbi:hypothetical protein FHR34_007207 [Kitasatospora kifunensis]|uniref:Uncharacterized protein n=1 Tax=Kitasatospora kifunensis TaxID=58351 RepID=A0A7W7R9W0_KITKI|nr:hypothetical protein [Kitasatospora kifunensis]
MADPRPATEENPAVAEPLAAVGAAPPGPRTR